MNITIDRLRKIINEEVTTLVNEAGGLTPITVGEVRQWKNATVHQLARTSMYFVVVGPENWSHSDAVRFGGKISMAGSILGAKTGDVLPDSTVGVVIKPVEMRANKAYELHDAHPVTVPVKIVRLSSSVLAGMKVTEPDVGDPDVEAPPVVDKKQEKLNVAAAYAAAIDNFIKTLEQEEGRPPTDREIINMLMNPLGEFKLSKYLAGVHLANYKARYSNDAAPHFTTQGGMMENSLRTLRRVIREELARVDEIYVSPNSKFVPAPPAAPTNPRQPAAGMPGSKQDPVQALLDDLIAAPDRESIAASPASVLKWLVSSKRYTLPAHNDPEPLGMNTRNLAQRIYDMYHKRLNNATLELEKKMNDPDQPHEAGAWVDGGVYPNRRKRARRDSEDIASDYDIEDSEDIASTPGARGIETFEFGDFFMAVGQASNVADWMDRLCLRFDDNILPQDASFFKRRTAR